MDRPGASWSCCMQQLQQLHAAPVALQLPLGAAAGFVGVVDLIHEVALV
ncbi:hypothetical protein ETH_00040690, partial [Eimeria tenella]